MARFARETQFSSDEMAVVQIIHRAVRRVYFAGFDKYSGVNYDYRKAWFECRLEQLAAFFAIDLLTFSIGLRSQCGIEFQPQNKNRNDGTQQLDFGKAACEVASRHESIRI